MSNLSETVWALLVVICVLAAFLVAYLIFLMHKWVKLSRKIEYLVDDLTYKSELLNPTSETLSRFAKYMSTFELATKRNMSSLTKFLVKNRSLFYKINTQIKRVFKNYQATEATKKTPQTNNKTKTKPKKKRN